MSDCNDGKKLLEVLMDTEVAEDERQKIFDHAETCPSCGELRKLHDYLEKLGMPEPEESELLQIRRSVMRSVRSELAAGGSGGMRRWLGDSLSGSLSGVRATPVFAMLAVGILLLAIGYVAGRWPASESVAVADSDPTSITGQLEYAAARNQRSTGGADSPFVYSNVRLQEVDPSAVRLMFDVTAQLDVVRAKDDPLVAEILVQSLLNHESVGTRLAAIEAAGRLEPAVRDALITSMLEDESLAVRLKAISKLTAELGVGGGDEVVQDALLEVLRREESVQLRLLAIEHLARERVSPEALRAAVSVGRPEPGTAIYAKANDYVRDF